MSDAVGEGCRADVWLWRARFFKTRALACRAIEDGRVRLTRAGAQTRLDKPSRNLRPGDLLVFPCGGRVASVRFEAPGVRRGPPAEARGLYSELALDTSEPAPATAAIPPPSAGA